MSKLIPGLVIIGLLILILIYYQPNHCAKCKQESFFGTFLSPINQSGLKTSNNPNQDFGKGFGLMSMHF